MEACMAIGTDFPKMLQAIHTYAVRNDNLHNPIYNLIAEGNFPQNATTLCDDLAELGNIMPVDMGDEKQFMRAVLLELKDSWFEILEAQKKALIAGWEATQTAAHKKVVGQAVQAQAIANEAENRLDALNDDDQLVRQLSIGTPSDTIPAPRPINKRKAFKHLDSTASAKKKAWEIIQKKPGWWPWKPLELPWKFKRSVAGWFISYKDSFGTSSPSPASSSKEKPPKWVEPR